MVEIFGRVFSLQKHLAEYGLKVNPFCEAQPLSFGGVSDLETSSSSAWCWMNFGQCSSVGSAWCESDSTIKHVYIAFYSSRMW